MARRGRSIGGGAIALATGMLIALPTFSNGATVTNELRSFDSVQTRVGPADPPRTKPPLHGTNPHGQGTAAVVDLAPNEARPFTVDETGTADDEDIVIGRSRGEQRADGTYHGHVTVAALFGNEIIGGADTNAGDAPVDRAIAEDLLRGLCESTRICIEAARVRSATTSTGSINSFSLTNLALGGPVPTPGVPGPVPALTIRAAESVGNIVSDGTCQTAAGGSQVADVATETAVAEIAESASVSRACRGAAPTQANTSRVIELGGSGVPLPAAGCADGTPDTVTGLPPLLPIVCNADDSSATDPPGNQAAAPYGVRNALDVYVLEVGATALAQISAAQSESLAVSPAAATTPPPPPPPPTAEMPPPPVTPPPPATAPPAAGDEGPGAGADDDDAGNEGAGDEGAGDEGAGDDGAGDDGGAGAAGPTANLGDKQLPFTGTDVVVLGLAGSLLLAAGLTLRGPVRRRELDS